MKKRWIGYGVAAVFLAALAIPAWAGDIVQNVDARLRPDYHIMMDGREMHFKRADGTPAFALVYEDATYLPLRAIGEVLGKNVNWDESTKTITLSGSRAASENGAAATGTSKTVTAQLRPDFTVVMDGRECQFRTSDGDKIYPLLYEGSTYLPLRAIGEMMDKEVAWNQATKTVTLSGGGLTVTDADSFSTNSNANSNSAITTDIGTAQAKQIALHHAGLTAAGVQWLDMDTDWDDGRKEYEIDFCDGTTEYEYVVDAATGTICKSATDLYTHHNHPHSYGHDSHNAHHGYSSGVSAADIGAAQAKQIALQHAGLTAAGVQQLRAEADWENGRKVYEVEFRVGTLEYEYEISATDGAIWKAETEYDD